MHVEDHPLEYGGFEGIIPERPVRRRHGDAVGPRHVDAARRSARGLCARARLKFELDGEKLNGGWTLVRTRGSKYGGKGDKRAWLLIKERDDVRARGATLDRRRRRPTACVSGRSLDEIARDARARVALEAFGQGERAAPARSCRRRPRRSAKSSDCPSPRAGAKARRCRATLSPMLATLVERAARRRRLAARDQVRRLPHAVPHRARQGATLLAQRQGLDRGASADRRDGSRALPVQQAWIDGEVCVLDADGPHELPGAAERAGRPAPTPLDVLRLRPAVPRRLRPARRRAGRAQAPAARDCRRRRRAWSATARTSQGRGSEFFRQACKLGLEGIVSKRADSTYATGARTRDWVKVKCVQRQEMVIGGYTEPQGARRASARCCSASTKHGKLRYAGKVGTGFDDTMLRELCGRCCDKREQRQAAVRQSAARLRGEGRALGRAGARRRGRVHRMERRRRAAPSVVPGIARGQEGSRRGARATRDALPQAAAQDGDASRAPGKRTVAKRARAQRMPKSDGRRRRRRQRSRIPTSCYFPEAKLTKRDSRSTTRPSRRGCCRTSRTAAEPRALPRRLERAVLLPEARRQERERGGGRVEVPEGGGTATYYGRELADGARRRSCNGA